jgi:uncharacterized protein
MHSHSTELLPDPSIATRVTMRDGVELDTYIWLPDYIDAKVPAILIRTPYSRAVFAINEPPKLRYLAAGYALILQQIRGIGKSGGHFSFNAPHEQADGYDTVEWIAAQDWCTGAVGLDGHSYAGMTQLTTAAAKPPHLKCMVPAVPSADFFLEPPYIGGIFSRMHALVWGATLQFPSLLSEDAGDFAMLGFLTNPALLARWLSRPVQDAAIGELKGDLLTHYQDALAHPTYDDWWKQRTLGPAQYAAMDIPTLLVTGNFDPSTGALTVWRGLEASAGDSDKRTLFIGPWDHNACYNGGVVREALFGLTPEHGMDLVGERIAFFDRHLKGIAAKTTARPRVQIFITGCNSWLGTDCFPPKATTNTALFLLSGGHANSSRGDGQLSWTPSSTDLPADQFRDDPAWPFVGALTMAKGPEFAFDMREREASHDTLVYGIEVSEDDLTVIGEPILEVYTSADVPDADIVAFLVEHREDGSSIFLAFGQLRLRYHEGFDKEVELAPNVPVLARIQMTYVAHTFKKGTQVRLLISGNNFPLLDPNPHVSGPIATASTTAIATQSILHDTEHLSKLTLSILAQTDFEALKIQPELR